MTSDIIRRAGYDYYIIPENPLYPERRPKRLPLGPLGMQTDFFPLLAFTEVPAPLGVLV